MTLCRPCEAETKRPGKHRRHGCAGQRITGTAAVVCDCPCLPSPTALIERWATDARHRQGDAEGVQTR